MEKILYTGKDDEQFKKPFIDIDEWRDEPSRHRYVHGGFEGTNTKFSFHFPPVEDFLGRFFHFLAPVVGDETEAQRQTGIENKLLFALSHGAYFVETNHGGPVNRGGDSTLVYRANACAAVFSRVLAEKMYGMSRIFGYLFGGSGGAYKTISCVENTIGVWDGAVPFVIGSPMAMPYVFTVRVHAIRLLRNKLDRIRDALEPGGSGDPYEGLTDEEAEALKEATLMGFPLKTWCVYPTLGDGALPVLSPAIGFRDPGYYKDFWSVPGYLGAEENSSAIRDRVLLETQVERIASVNQSDLTSNDKNAYGVDEAWKKQLAHVGDAVIYLQDMPSKTKYLKGLKLTVLSGAAEGKSFAVRMENDAIVVDAASVGTDVSGILAALSPGGNVKLDNSDYIAIQTYHRHQVPESPEYHGWDQFRQISGAPIYPQRDVIIGPQISTSGAGSIQNGRPTCKMIVIESLMDESAFPWQADWYRQEVIKNLGGDHDFRLWYMDNCMHTDCEEGNGGDHQHIVSYLGALWQALLDLSDWVELGIEPPQSSHYSLDGAQVIIPPSAGERRGIQPVSELLANGQKKAVVRPGECVTFTASISAPDGSGTVESVRWDFEATDDFTPCGTLKLYDDGHTANASATHIFTKPGTYFPVIKVASNRHPGDIFTQILNQDRVRVVVEDGTE